MAQPILRGSGTSSKAGALFQPVLKMRKIAITGFHGRASVLDGSGVLGAGEREPVWDGTAHLRPSTARRIERLRALVSELRVRDMGLVAIAAFLECSASAARNYVFELLDAGVVRSPPIKRPAGCVERTVYRLNTETLLLREFDAGKETCKSTLAARGAQEHRAAVSADLLLNIRDGSNPSFGVGRVPPRRDPLVTALFGAPSGPGSRQTLVDDFEERETSHKLCG